MRMGVSSEEGLDDKNKFVRSEFLTVYKLSGFCVVQNNIEEGVPLLLGFLNYGGSWRFANSQKFKSNESNRSRIFENIEKTVFSLLQTEPINFKF